MSRTSVEGPVSFRARAQAVIASCMSSVCTKTGLSIHDPPQGILLQAGGL